MTRSAQAAGPLLEGLLLKALTQACLVGPARTAPGRGFPV